MKHMRIRFAAALLCVLLLCALLPLGTLAAITPETGFVAFGDPAGAYSISVCASSTNFASASIKGLKYKEYTGANEQLATIHTWINGQLNSDLPGWTDATNLNWQQNPGNQCRAMLGGLKPNTLYMFCAYYGNPATYSFIGQVRTYRDAEDSVTKLSHSATDSSVVVKLENLNANMPPMLYFTRLNAPVSGWSSKTPAEKLAWRNAQTWEQVTSMTSSGTSGQAVLYPLDSGEHVAYYTSRIDYAAKTEYVSDIQFAQAAAGTRDRSTDVWSVKFKVEPYIPIMGNPSNPNADKLTVSFAPAFEPSSMAKLQVCASPDFSGTIYTALSFPSTSQNYYPGMLYPVSGWLADESMQPLNLITDVYYYRLMVLDSSYRVHYSNVRFFEVKSGHIQSANTYVWNDSTTSVGVTNGLMSDRVRSAVAFGVADASGSAVSPAAGTTVDLATLYRLGFTASGTAVYPEAYTTVKIPVPAGVDASKLTPIYVDDEGVAHPLTTKLDIGRDSDGNEALREVPMTPTVTTEGGVTYVSFETNHFSTYGLAQVTTRSVSVSPTTTVISNAEGNILAEGTFGPGYTLTSRALSTKSTTYKQLAKLKETGSVLGSWDVRLSPAWPGNVSLSFNLGQRNANRDMTLLHLLDNGSVEYLYGTTDGIGRLTVSTRDCSTFMIVQGHIAASLLSIPDTGSAPQLLGVYVLFCLPAALFALISLPQKRKKAAK